MDFFEAQEQARKRTKWMILLFILAVVSISVSLYFVFVFGLGYLDSQTAPDGRLLFEFYQPKLFFVISGAVILLVGISSFIKTSQLKSGGAVVAKSLGGRKLNRATKNFSEKQLLNIVEEMSIASGVTCPDVYLIEEEGINAFAAGFNSSDAVIGVTRGCIDGLSRDELQGVIAHEFSHILNGDMRINIRLMGVLFGILVISILGQMVLRGTAHGAMYSGSRRSKNSGGSAVIVIMIIGLAVMIIGYLGVFFGRLIQSAISRQREFLADAAAVQFTRNPDGIAGALRRIGGTAKRGVLETPHAQETAHLFFASALKSSFLNGFATHPPLPERIKAIDKNWDGSFLEPKTKKEKSSPPPLEKPKNRDDFIKTIGVLTAASVLQAQDICKEIASPLEKIKNNVNSSKAVLFALQLIASGSKDYSEGKSYLSGKISEDVLNEVIKWLDELKSFNLNQRLALLDVALPCLAESDWEALKSYESLMLELAKLDQEVFLEELAIVRVLSNFIKNRSLPNRSYRPLPPAKLEKPICLMLSALARSSSSDEAQQVSAFQAGAKKSNRYLLNDAKLLESSDISFEELDRSLDMMESLPVPQKQIIFESALSVVLADKKVDQQEYNLIRIIAASLNLPMPPIALSPNDTQSGLND